MSQTPPPSQTIDPYKHLHLLRNPDNTITRLLQIPHTSPSSDTTLPTTVLTKDITINQENKTWLRLFLPNKPLPNNHKLPLIVFFHGSGFILASAGSTMFHDFCVNMVDEIGVFVVSVGYRLAPEHRLPAAYDDAMEALFWIRSMEDEWLRLYVDYSKCYLMGQSAGATIAYHADEGKECKLVDYTNSSWCSDVEDRKSIVGYVFMLGGAPVACSLRKEPVVALSSCGVEYIVVSLCACQATWMVNLVEEITWKNHGAITMKTDNMSTINLAKNPIAYGRSKHIEMRFHYLREKVANEKLNLEHCRTENQIVDIMTKGVQVILFK